ncbi:MAG: Asp23/Gls24 family envelope stress response protein [Gaiellaceae bacterium]
MAGRASISADILARYAADAAREVGGVRGVPKRAVKIAGENGSISVELQLTVEWGASIPTLAREVQERVREYLARMADVVPASVDVVVDEIGPAA